MTSTVFTATGQRKYLTANEIDTFVRTSGNVSPEVQSFCWMMAYTGCRISEALSLTSKSIDFEARLVIIECLKKRRKSVYRAVPLPPALLSLLQRWLGRYQPDEAPLWPWSRMTGYRRICTVMDDAGVRGAHATPKGLRHGFGVRAIQAGAPLPLVQRWLGHADIKTTAIYTNVTGPEEREIAARMWARPPAARAAAAHVQPSSAKPGDEPPVAPERPERLPKRYVPRPRPVKRAAKPARDPLTI